MRDDASVTSGVPSCPPQKPRRRQRQRPSTRRLLVRPRPLTWRAATAACVSLLAYSPSQWLATASSSSSAHPPHRQLVDALAGVDLPKILQDIGPVDCPNATYSTIKTFVDNNKLLYDTCISQSGYKLYPYGAKYPTPEETSKMCASPSCMDLLSGLILVKLPECEYNGHSVRSFAESFLRVRVDLSNKRQPPSASEFGDLYILNRVVNYLTENITIQAKIRTTFQAADVQALMNPLNVNPDVVLSGRDNLVVAVDKNKRNSSNSNSSSASGSSSSSKSSRSRSSSSGSKEKSSSSTGFRVPSHSQASASSSAMERAADDAEALPDNLRSAYIYVGVGWLVVNIFYLFLMAGKAYH